MKMLKIIHIRHPDAKRKDARPDEEAPKQSFMDEESGTIFDHYYPHEDLFMVL